MKSRPAAFIVLDWSVSGGIGIVAEITAAERIDTPSRRPPLRLPWLTFLASHIVEAIMDGQQPAELGVHVLREGFPVEWGEQRAVLTGGAQVTVA